MAPSHPADWLYAKYGRKPGSIVSMIKMARGLTFPAGEVGSGYRDKMCRRAGLIDLIQTTSVPDEIEGVFRRRFSQEDVDDIRKFILFLVFLALPDQAWPCEIRFDTGKGEPIIGDLDAAWDRAEQLVVGFLALHALAQRSNAIDDASRS